MVDAIDDDINVTETIEWLAQLLQSSARELRPLLLFIWTKILAVDVTCQADLVRDGGHKYFLTVLQDTSIAADQRTLAAFVIARVVWNHPAGQEAVSQVGFISDALDKVYNTIFFFFFYIAKRFIM